MRAILNFIDKNKIQDTLWTADAGHNEVHPTSTHAVHWLTPEVYINDLCRAKKESLFNPIPLWRIVRKEKGRYEQVAQGRPMSVVVQNQSDKCLESIWTSSKLDM